MLNAIFPALPNLGTSGPIDSAAFLVMSKRHNHIDLWRRVYPPDVFVTLWNKLEALIADGRFCSHREVMKELEKRDDELLKWAKLRKGMFAVPDATQQVSVQRLLAKFPGIVDSSRTGPQADPFVIARAECEGLTVVTSETPVGSTTGKRLKIPDVCQARQIPCTNLLGMFRKLGWKV